MAKTILQRVKFNVPPERLFDIYMDSKKHSAAIAARASIGRGVGSKFNAHNGWIRGKNVAIVRKRMIVQTWRGADWKKADLDSILILTFAKAPGGARLTLVHANVPDRKSPSINKGWHTHYWNRWKAYLKRTS
jgi:activator of HSP90 ATPase